jgi:branched-chain amino acid transport system substrate-binding protein
VIFLKSAIAVSVATFILAGCGKGGDKTAAAPADGVEVKIGHVAPLTGPIAHLGKDNENGARLAIEEINKSGLTIDGKKVVLTLVPEDDAEDPKTATQVAQKLVDAKVVGVVGHLNSGFIAMPELPKFLHQRRTPTTPSKDLKLLIAWWPLMRNKALR